MTMTAQQKTQALIDAVGGKKPPTFTLVDGGFKINQMLFATEDVALLFQGGWQMMQSLYAHREAVDNAAADNIRAAITRLAELGETGTASAAESGLNDLLDSLYAQVSD